MKSEWGETNERLRTHTIVVVCNVDHGCETPAAAIELPKKKTSDEMVADEKKKKPVPVGISSRTGREHGW